MAQSEKRLGESFQLLLTGFREIEKSLLATPREKEAIKAGIDAIITLECYLNRTKTMPYAHTAFDEGIDIIKEIADSWTAIDKAQKAYKKAKRRQMSTVY